MADEDDQWLYGDSTNPEASENDNQPDAKTSEHAESDKPQETDDQLAQGVDGLNGDPPADSEPAPGTSAMEDNDTGQQNGEGSEKEDSDEDDDDDSDDDVNVVIGDFKTSPSYSLNVVKRGGLLTSTAGGDKLKQPGKFSIDEFESVGIINGVQAQEYNVDNLEDKPWRKPGADITDYFNYGFNEDTWRAYCERQKRLRVNESGVGLAPMNSIGMPRSATAITNDNSKYSGNLAGPRKAGPPPGRRMMGSIDVIGGNSGLASRRGNEIPVKATPPKENVIQVMTADRREYSRKPGFPDMTVPPPTSFNDFQPEFGFNPEPEPEYWGYEPTQDCQWGTEPTWTPSEIKELTPGPVTPVQTLPLSVTPIPNQSDTPPPKDDSPTPRDSENSSSRARSEKPKDRERSHRRERSRSRSRRHKSRSRSPSHRSHRKKKSRRHDDSD